MGSRRKCQTFISTDSLGYRKKELMINHSTSIRDRIMCFNFCFFPPFIFLEVRNIGIELGKVAKSDGWLVGSEVSWDRVPIFFLTLIHDQRPFPFYGRPNQLNSIVKLDSFPSLFSPLSFTIWNGKSFLVISNKLSVLMFSLSYKKKNTQPFV